MKTQVQEITTRTIELLNTKPKRGKSYFALLIISVICFLLMTVSGVLFAMTEKTAGNELLYTIFFGVTMGGCAILFFCLFIRMCHTYKFKWTTIGLWNVVVSTIALCSTLIIVGLYSVDFFELTNIVISVDETSTIVQFCLLALIIVCTILTFLALCFMCGFDFVYKFEGQYAPSLETRKIIRKDNNKNILNWSQKWILAEGRRQQKIDKKLAKENSKAKTKIEMKEAKVLAKIKIKGVDEELLSEFDAVCKRVAKIMATNAMKKKEIKIREKKAKKEAKMKAKLAKKAKDDAAKSKKDSSDEKTKKNGGVKPLINKPIVLSDQQVVITFDKKLGKEKINKKIAKIEKSLGHKAASSPKKSGINIKKETVKK